LTLEKKVGKEKNNTTEERRKRDTAQSGNGEPGRKKTKKAYIPSGKDLDKKKVPGGARGEETA